ncbi:MAG: hypothetical protein AB7U20_14310 [Planctomycetaceae bacterium]
MHETVYDHIADYIRQSSLPRKQQKLAGLSTCRHRRIPMRLLPLAETGESMILVGGIAIDPSELENGHWL